MNRERAKKLLPIIQAFADGKDIELKISEGYIFYPQTNPIFDSSGEYRIKPEPFECWVIFDEERVPLAMDVDRNKLNTNLSNTTTVHMREVE